MLRGQRVASTGNNPCSLVTFFNTRMKWRWTIRYTYEHEKIFITWAVPAEKRYITYRKQTIFWTIMHLHFICIVTRIAERWPILITWYARWNVSDIQGMYSTCPFWKEPIDNIWKGEGREGIDFRIWLDRPSVCHNQGRSVRCLH